MAKYKYKDRHDARLVPHYLIAEQVGVDPKTIKRWSDEFGYKPEYASSLIRFLLWIGKTKTLDNPIA